MVLRRAPVSTLVTSGGDPNAMTIGLQLTSCMTGSGSSTEPKKQQFIVSGNVASKLGTCLTGQDPDFTDRTTTVTGTCSQNRSLIWDYYWRQN